MQPVPGRLWGLSKTFEATKVACIKTPQDRPRPSPALRHNVCVPRLRVVSTRDLAFSTKRGRGTRIIDTWNRIRRSPTGVP